MLDVPVGGSSSEQVSAEAVSVDKAPVDPISSDQASVAVPSCLDQAQVVEIASKRAEASLLSNIFSSGETLSKVVKVLTARVEKELGTYAVPDCLSACSGTVSRRAQFKVAPHSYLKTYKEQDVCLARQSETKKKPLSFERSGISRTDEFSSWFGEFVRGSGIDGKKLYENCPGSCSPRYEVDLFKKENNNYQAEVDAICGEARDKKDNTYDIKLSYIFQCQ